MHKLTTKSGALFFHFLLILSFFNISFDMELDGFHEFVEIQSNAQIKAEPLDGASDGLSFLTQAHSIVRVRKQLRQLRKSCATVHATLSPQTASLRPYEPTSSIPLEWINSSPLSPRAPPFSC